MERAIKVTQDRRKIQEAYNKEHGITPAGIKRAISERMQQQQEAETGDVKKFNLDDIPKDERKHLITELSKQMELAAENLQFEKAALLRDQIGEIKEAMKSSTKK
jgi:excinuclease ABC subunit B